MHNVLLERGKVVYALHDDQDPVSTILRQLDAKPLTGYPAARRIGKVTTTSSLSLVQSAAATRVSSLTDV